MTSEVTRKAARDKELQKEALEIAQREADARSEDDLIGTIHTPPLERDDEHSFIQAEEYEGDVAELAPDLTGVGVKGLVLDPPATIDVKADDVVHKIPLTVERLEIMSDEDIADAGLLTEAPPLVHPARIAPTSERQRTPYQRSPAAGPGSWPVPEDALPAVVPSDPPKEDGEDPGDGTLTGYPPFKAEGRKVAVYSSKGVKSEVEPDETKNAAALYLRLRNQFPHFTEDQLSDEFIIQWEARVGAKQSFRPSQELSQHGDTAVADPRVTQVNLGEEREDASVAQPRSVAFEPSAANTPEAGLPSLNEPASRYKDDEKFGLESGELKSQDKADLLAIEQTKALRESEETGEPLPEPPPVIEQDSGRNVPLPPSFGAGAAGTGGAKIAGPKPTQLPADKPNEKGADVLPESQRPGPAKSEVKSASKPDEPKKGK